MKKLVSALLALIIATSSLLLTGCKDRDGAPEGMRLVKGGEDVGYYFFGPEEWVVANVGDIACTYASKVDTSSMTFAEAPMPEGDVDEYFESEKAKFAYEITVTSKEDCIFGEDGRTARKYVYNYEYLGYPYSCMQIFVKDGDSFYIFTYTASSAEYKEGKSYFEFYLEEKVLNTIESFKFTQRQPAVADVPQYETNIYGYKLVSNKVLCGFDMYVPSSFKVDVSSVMVSASHPDGTNINMSTATYTGVTNEDYWNNRKESLNQIVDKVTDESGSSVSSLTEIAVAKSVSVPGTNWALAYEYTYELQGVKYHVYQVLIVEGTVNGYVFTYTAEQEHYDEHLSEMNLVLTGISY